MSPYGEGNHGLYALSTQRRERPAAAAGCPSMSEEAMRARVRAAAAGVLAVMGGLALFAFFAAA